MARLRTTQRLLANSGRGSGKAQVVDRSGQLAHIRWRHPGVILDAEILRLSECLGSGLCVNEETRVKVFDAVYQDSDLKEVYVILGIISKAGSSRPAFFRVWQYGDALMAWRGQHY